MTMSSGVTPYNPPPPLRSLLLKSPTDAVPPTEELDALQEELKTLRYRALERAKKAGEDLRAIEETMRRAREREKGKSKAVDKIKKERAFTPLPNGDEKRHSAQPQHLHKSRLPSLPVGMTHSAASTPSFDPRKSMADELRKKKKKRKREDGSDDETASVKARKTTPVPQPHSHSHPPPAKASKHPSTIPHPHAKPSSGPDFTLPPTINPMLPVRPPIPPPPIPGPSKPVEVTEDFSKAKQPSQVLVTTFYSSVEPYFRPIKEEDIGFLEYSHDEVEPFVMPKLGRHYTEVWEEEDIAQYGGPLPGLPSARVTLPGSSSTAPLPKWEPSTLMETDVITEERGHGPLTERLVSAMIPMQNSEWKGVKAAEEAMEGRPGTNGAAAQAARDKLNVADLEERVKNVMRFHGLLDQLPNFNEAVDDPIASALRHAQRELRTVMATNKQRRARLAAIARDRLGYQEYIELRDSLDKNINNLYTKLQKKDGPKANKKKKKAVEVNGVNGAALGPPAPSPAALGLVQDEDFNVTVPDQLKHLVETRRQWVDTVGSVFDAKQQESPGRIWGFPERSIFEGVDEEVQREQGRTMSPQGTSGVTLNGVTLSPDTRTTDKGKVKVRVDSMAMDIG